MITKCSCKHEYQDSKYGNGNRVFNESLDKLRNLIGRCTVCSREIRVADKSIKKQ